MRKIIKNENTIPLIITIMIALLCRATFMIYIVNGESMYPTLQDGNIGIAKRTTISDINRYDIVIVKTEDKYLIKRVIGLPGEDIEYKNNKLYINNIESNDDFSYLTEDFKTSVGEDEYFCVGDNRQNSLDSRMLGNFKTNKIKAITFKD